MKGQGRGCSVLLRGRRAGRAARVGAVAALVLAFSASAALGTTSRAARRGAPSPVLPSLGVHVPVSVLEAAGTKPSLTPRGGAAPATKATNSPVGAGQEAHALLESASVSFKVPTFSCASSSDTEELLPGIWIFDNSGNLDGYVAVALGCGYGSVYGSEYICLTGGTCVGGKLTVQPGDLIEAGYSQTATEGAAGTIWDHTQNLTDMGTGASLPETGNFVLLGDAGPSLEGFSAVPTFRSIAFTIATINGQYIADWAPAQLDLQTASDVQISSGAAKTTSFKTTFKANN